MDSLAIIGDVAPARLQAMKRRLRSRYPMLRDGAPAAVHQRPVQFAPAVRHLALRSLHERNGRLAMPVSSGGRFAAGVGEVDPRHPARLRPLLARTDAPGRILQQTAPKVVLAATSPSQVHAYWRIPPQVIRNARSALGERARGAAFVLRFHDVSDILFDGDNAHSSFDIPVALEEGRRAVEVNAPGRCYLCELGLRTESDFLALTQSNTVAIARAVGGGEDARFDRCEVGELVRPATPALFRVPVAPVVLGPDDADWPERDLQAESMVQAVYRRFLREGPRALRLAGAVPRLAPERCRSEYDARRQRRQRQADSRRLAAREEAARPEFFLARLDEAQPFKEMDETEATLYPPAVRRPEVAPLAQRADAAAALPALLSTLAARQNWIDRSPLAKLTREKVERSQTRTLRAKKAGRVASAVTEAGLELSAELILRGKVQPGRKVRVGGLLIDPEPDGSFCISCVVKNGRLHVPVEAVEAEAVVERREVAVDLGATA